MKYLYLQAEADFINRHFANHPIVTVIADGLWDTDSGDHESQIGVDIVAPAARTIEANREREAALSAALAELEKLPIIESVERIGGMIYVEEGFGDRFFATISFTEWRVGSDGRLYRH